jgi:hypothetical protein
MKNPATYRTASPALLLLLPSLLIAFVRPGTAQEGRASRIEGFIFAAPGIRTHEQAVTGITHVGGGCDIFLFRGLAAEAELGYLRPWGRSSQELGMSSVRDEDLGMFSLSAIYHKFRGRKLSPLVFAGVSLGLRDRTLGLHALVPLEQAAETLTLLNFGVGATYWFTDGKGLRVELRDHLYTAETDRHYLEFRIAFAFR